MTWAKKDRRIVEQNYLTMKDADISSKLLPHKSTRAITEARRRWGLKKQMHWTQEEIAILRQHKALKTNKELSVNLLLNRSEGTIATKCYLLGITKKTVQPVKMN